MKQVSHVLLVLGGSLILIAIWYIFIEQDPELLGLPSGFALLIGIIVAGIGYILEKERNKK